MRISEPTATAIHSGIESIVEPTLAVQKLLGRDTQDEEAMLVVLDCWAEELAGWLAAMVVAVIVIFLVVVAVIVGILVVVVGAAVVVVVMGS
jgi:hypothetical protein